MEIFSQLTQVLTALKPLLGDSQLLFLLAIGVTFSLLVLAALYLVSRAIDPMRRRLFDEGENSENNDNTRLAKKIDRSVKPFKGVIVPTKAKELSATANRLVYAGFRGKEVVTAYYAVKFVLIVGIGILFALVAFFYFRTDTVNTLYAMLAGSTLGFIIPSYYLDKRIDKRQTQIINAFPDVLDLLVACTEAGLGLNAAIQRVARETEMMYPVLSAELEQVNIDIRSGVERTEALKGLATRTGVEDISGFVSMISQSVRFGTSMAQTMRVYAEDFRDKRMQRAEEKAAKVSTKLIFPLVLCIFPSFFAVAIGPAVIAIVRAFEQL